MKVTIDNAFRPRKNGITVDGMTLGQVVYGYILKNPGTTKKTISSAPWYKEGLEEAVHRCVDRLTRRGILVRRQVDDTATFYANDKFVAYRKRKRKNGDTKLTKAKPETKTKTSTNVEVTLLVAIGKHDTLVSWDEGKALWAKLDAIYGQH